MLAEIFARYPGTDKHTTHSYAPFYQDLFGAIRESVRNVLEIGVRDGSSLFAWRDYFPNATIWGIDDWSEACPTTPQELLGNLQGGRFAVETCDTLKPDKLRWFAGGIPAMDIVIDDGNHHPFAQVAAFSQLWPLCSRYYVIEDLEGIDNANRMAAMFGGRVADFRERTGRWDDILVWFARA